MSDSNSMTTVGPFEINLIFKTLDLVYPEFLKGKTEEDVKYTKRIWLQSLSRYESSMALQVLEQVPDRFPKFCPKLGEFKALCHVRPEHKSFPRLEFVADPKNPSKAAKDAMKAMRNLVKDKKQ